MNSPKAKPLKGHKLANYSFGVAVNCECGWRSGTWFGKGARGSALGEWHSHKDRCAAEQNNGSL